MDAGLGNSSNNKDIVDNYNNSAINQQLDYSLNVTPELQNPSIIQQYQSNIETQMPSQIQSQTILLPLEPIPFLPQHQQQPQQPQHTQNHESQQQNHVQQQSLHHQYNDHRYSEENWNTPQCRENVANKIHDAIQFANLRGEYSGSDMENHAFKVATSYDEYVRLVAKIITHLRDSRSN